MTKQLIRLLFILICFSNCTPNRSPREVSDFNRNWDFHLGDTDSTLNMPITWHSIDVPHDWSIREGYHQNNTAASTGFVKGGIGWYKKEFSLPKSDQGQTVWIEFDGVYCNSEVWINGHHLGFRPSGYSSFSYDLTGYLDFEKHNTILVKVDHSAYADSRWYTGSGIYRNVRLVKTSLTHIPQWGVRVTTPEVSPTSATIHLQTNVVHAHENTTVNIHIFSPQDELVFEGQVQKVKEQYVTDIYLDKPKLWGIESPSLYKAIVYVKSGNKLVDQTETTFGIRSFHFDANTGFHLNNKKLKIKGVNLHHDAGALGAAVPKSIWQYRIRQLKSIGTNAIRMAHNPHSPELMEVCDEMGMLVMNEFFDEWTHPKNKNLTYLGDGKGIDIPETKGYSTHFSKWAERDLKDLIKRDFNHPSVILWSIGNEIEWTFPSYSKTFLTLNKGYTKDSIPIFDSTKIRPLFKEFSQDKDSLTIIARQLSQWVKEEDNTRPVSCGTVVSTISMTSGYREAVDVFGMNYETIEYDKTHRYYPNTKIIGTENWGNYQEWKGVEERDFVSGLFLWTGFAYLGEAGPWPRKGLDVSLFDLAGFKTPRGHFYECLWHDQPKVYAVTTPAKGAEYTYNENEGWGFNMQMAAPPVWSAIRRWEWYRVNEHWNYHEGDSIIVQAYTNSEEAELFINDQSYGRLAMSEFPDDHIIKWLVPFRRGKALIKSYSKHKLTGEYSLMTSGYAKQIELSCEGNDYRANVYEIIPLEIQLKDTLGNPIRHEEHTIHLKVSGQGELLALDNGWEKNVQSHYQNKIETHQGRAMAFIKPNGQVGEVSIKVSGEGLKEEEIKIGVH